MPLSVDCLLLKTIITETLAQNFSQRNTSFINTKIDTVTPGTYFVPFATWLEWLGPRARALIEPVLTAWKAAHWSVSGHQGAYEMREIVNAARRSR